MIFVKLQVTATDYICHACHTLLSERDTDRDVEAGQCDPAPAVGHQNVCIRCGRSLVQKRSHTVLDDANRHILEIVQNWVQPREVSVYKTLI